MTGGGGHKINTDKTIYLQGCQSHQLTGMVIPSLLNGVMGLKLTPKAEGMSICIEHTGCLRLMPIVYTMVILNICYREEGAFREPNQPVHLWVML